ncbi:MAG: PKD domain-containing protein [Bacteroidetes bacterium]|nr:PKD domain-containing protein [Bacteroidota bacterium]
MYDPMTGNLNTSCPNSNFSLGNFNDWTGCKGWYNINCNCNTPGIDTVGSHHVHKLIRSSWHDHNTCDTLLTLFPGESYSARLGDTSYSSGSANNLCPPTGFPIPSKKEAELTYQINVTSSTYLLIYRYAVVLQTGNHTGTQHQPDFRIQITNASGTVLDSTCGYYYITAQVTGPPVAGWHRCRNNSNGDVYWKDWTTVGMDLAPYLGQTVYVKFKARGCSYDTHFGYAYISVYCSSLIIQTALCEGDSTATLTAPPGFSSYIWNTGETTPQITVPHPATGSQYWVKLTAYNGCSDTIWNTLTYTIVTADFNVTPSCPAHPTQFTDKSTVNQNQIVSWDWDWGDASGITTTTNPNPTHVYLNPGTYSVKMMAHSTEGCKDSIMKSVTIDTLALVTNNPMTKTICSGDHINLNITSNVTGAQFLWTATPQHPGTTSGYHNNAVLKTFLNDTLFNVGLIPDTIRYSISPHDNTCVGPDTVYKVVVLPKPGLTNSILSQSVCSNAPTTAVTLVPYPSPPAVVTFNWTAYPSSPLLTGYISSANGSLSIPSQTIINNTGVPQVVVDSITPYLQAVSACPGDKKGYVFTINPLPTPVISGLPSVCANTSGVTYSTPNVTGHDYLWTVTGATGFTGDHTNSIIVNWGAGPTGTVKVQEIDLNQPTNCSFTTPVTTVALNANPTPVISGVQNPCGLSLQTYTLGSPASGHSYDWNVSGGTPVSGNNSNISVTWGNTNPITINATETISYPGGVNCSAQAPPFPLTLILFPLPAGPITGTSAVCNTWTRTYTVPTITNADSYTWWYLPSTGVTITNNGASANLAFDLTATSGNLFVKGNKTGCGSGPSSPAYSVTVNPLPYVSLSSCIDPKTTTSSRPFYLKGGVPPSGRYYIDGNFVTGDLITPSTLATGNHLITYQYTDMNTCTSTTSSITLNVLSGSLLSSCPYTFTDARNSKIYHASMMGGRCWMLQNLDYGTKLDPDIQPQTDNCIIEKYCSTADVNCTNYGGLYQWDELMQYRVPAAGEYIQGLCPPEWHVPTSAEWQLLIDGQTNGGNGIAGGDLKDPNPALGFKAILMGLYYQNSFWAFTSGGLQASIFWTSTSYSGTRIVARGMNSYNESISVYNSGRSNALPVRCVKDF